MISHADVKCRQDTTFSNLLKKKFKNSIFHCYIWIQHEKCIKMSTNKPSIGAVVLDIAIEFGENSFKFKLFQTQTCSQHVEH